MSVYVGIDVHRKRSQVAVIDQGGEVLANRNVPNGTEPILSVIDGLPSGTPAAFEAAFGWGWLVELLEGYGFEPHLVHPLQCKAIASARLKNDKVDAAILAQLLRADLLPEAWLAPPRVRQLRALLRHRARPVRRRPRPSRSRLGPQRRTGTPRVAADHGYDRSASYWTGPGRGWLAELDLPAASREIVTDCLAGIDRPAPVIDGSTASCTSTPGPIPESRRSGRCRASGSSPHWSWWPRSATSPGSAAPASWPPGPGCPRPCAART